MTEVMAMIAALTGSFHIVFIYQVITMDPWYMQSLWTDENAKNNFSQKRLSMSRECCRFLWKWEMNKLCEDLWPTEGVRLSRLWAPEEQSCTGQSLPVSSGPLQGQHLLEIVLACKGLLHATQETNESYSWHYRILHHFTWSVLFSALYEKCHLIYWVKTSASYGEIRVTQIQSLRLKDRHDLNNQR